MGRSSLVVVEASSSADVERQRRVSSFCLAEEGVRAFVFSTVSSHVSTASTQEELTAYQCLSLVGTSELDVDSLGSSMSQVSAVPIHVADRVVPRGRRSSISSPRGKRPSEAELQKASAAKSPTPLRRMTRRTSLLRAFDKPPRLPSAKDELEAGSCKNIRAPKLAGSDCWLEQKMQRTWLTSSVEDRATIANLLRRGAR